MTGFNGIICLAGPPCSGKTSTALQLSKLLCTPFTDMDDVIEAEELRPIHRIFSESGESAFRKQESECLRSVLEWRPQVLALGGGALLDPDNLILVAERSLLITLFARDDVIVERCTGESRPLALTEECLRELLESRREHYLSLPNRVDTEGLTPGEVAARIVETFSIS